MIHLLAQADLGPFRAVSNDFLGLLRGVVVIALPAIVAVIGVVYAFSGRNQAVIAETKSRAFRLAVGVACVAFAPVLGAILLGLVKLAG